MLTMYISAFTTKTSVRQQALYIIHESVCLITEAIGKLRNAGLAVHSVVMNL